MGVLEVAKAFFISPLSVLSENGFMKSSVFGILVPSKLEEAAF